MWNCMYSLARNRNCGFRFLYILYVNRWEASLDVIVHLLHWILLNWLALPGNMPSFATQSITYSKSQNVLLNVQLLKKTRTLKSITISHSTSSLQPSLHFLSTWNWKTPTCHTMSHLRTSSLDQGGPALVALTPENWGQLQSASWTSCPDPQRLMFYVQDNHRSPGLQLSDRLSSRCRPAGAALVSISSQIHEDLKGRSRSSLKTPCSASQGTIPPETPSPVFTTAVLHSRDSFKALSENEPWAKWKIYF